MDDLFNSWSFVLMLASPFAFLLLISFLPISSSNPAYKLGWLNLLLLFIMSLVVSLYAYVVEKSKGGDSFAAVFRIVQVGIAQVLLYWIWLYKVKPKKQEETDEKSTILDEDDPILDERPPTQ